MKILAINRNALVNELIGAHAAALGHEFIAETVKGDGIDRFSQENFDIVMINPSPMNDPKAMALPIRRQAANYPYIVMLNETEVMHYNLAIQSGCNDLIQIPLDKADIENTINNGANLIRYFANLSDTATDFPNAGGIISKSAFNQICRSALERAGRYNERAYVLTLTIPNYKEIFDLDGKYVAQYCVSKMASHMVTIRRQSDIAGQIAENSYALLLQRTENEDEAIQAAKRYVSTFEQINDILPPEGHKADIRFEIMHLPSGSIPFTAQISKMK